MANTKTASDIVQEFTDLVRNSSLSMPDKEYFLNRFFEDGGLKEEVEKELIEKLEESGAMTRIAIELDKEENMKELEKQLEKVDAKGKVKELVDATIAYQKALDARDRAVEKHDKAFIKMEGKISKKHGGNEDTPQFLKDLHSEMEKYRSKHEPGFQKLVDAVDEAMARVDKAESAVEDLKNQV
jgi:hypothetical protein